MVLWMLFTLQFQPTLPARGATASATRLFTANYFNPRSPHGERRCRIPGIPCRAYFNPRSPHGERQTKVGLSDPAVLISTHAPRTGSDTHGSGRAAALAAFQPTLPARGATGVAGRWL